MLTLNADIHPLMNRMHKPDPKLGPDRQDKRSVVPIELEDVDAWLNGSPEAAAALVRARARGSVRCRPRRPMTHGTTRCSGDGALSVEVT
jgi:hypothetical protein